MTTFEIVLLLMVLAFFASLEMFRWCGAVFLPAITSEQIKQLEDRVAAKYKN